MKFDLVRLTDHGKVKHIMQELNTQSYNARHTDLPYLPSDTYCANTFHHIFLKIIFLHRYLHVRGTYTHRPSEPQSGGEKITYVCA